MAQNPMLLRPFSNWSLATRITLGWLVITAGLLFTFVWFSLKGSRETSLARGRALLAHEAEIAQVRMQAAVEGIARDAVFLAQGPAVRDYLATGDEAAQRRVEAEFTALLGSKKDYFQVRLLELSKEGNEIVRLDRAEDGNSTLIPKEQLQAKGDRDYFIESLPLRVGEIYLSEINLNRDFGIITLPHIPTLRAATKALGNGSDEPKGLIVINADLRRLFQSILNSRNPAIDIELGNEAGDFILHRDERKLYGKDLGITGEFNEARTDPDALHFEAAFPILLQHQRQARLRVTFSPEEIAAGAEQGSHKALVVTAIAGVASLMLVLAFARIVSRKLHQLALAVVEYQPGQTLPALPAMGQDEIGLLAAKFQTLAERVKEDLVRVDQARCEAEAATEAREHFLAMMSHEIRTPLNSVVGLLRTLERNRPPSHQKPILDALGIATRQLLQMVNEALDHSKIAAGKMEFVKAPFSLHNLLRDASQAYSPQARQKGLEFVSELAPELPDWVMGDAMRLNQVLHNLLSNALKFTGAGSIFLCAASAREGSGEVVIQIVDTGMGFHPDQAERIFQPFDQVDETVPQRFGGTGLGLALARQMVVLQGGSLEATSAGKDQGACFTLRIPLEAATPQKAESASASSKAPNAIPDWRGLHFLYIEDVPSNQEIMQLLLEDTGAKLTFASTGTEGIREWKAASPDVILLDLQLPDMDGLSVARQGIAALPPSRCWAVTAQVTAETRAACLEAGMLGLISKPIEASVFFDEIQRHLHLPSHAAPELMSGQAMDKLFRDDPVRRKRIFGVLAAEFEKHQSTLISASEAGDATRLAALRHQLHTAICELQLQELAATLDQLVEHPEDPVARENALKILSETSVQLRAKAEGEYSSDG